MKKFLLSTGKVTSRVELYILDQFKIYLTVHPGDIPGDDTLGFNFTLTNVMKSDLKTEVVSRVESLIRKIKARNGDSISISIDSIDIIDEERAEIVITVRAGGEITDKVNIDLYK